MAQTGSNNNLSARRYEEQFVRLLPAVFQTLSYFGDFFAGGLQALDGVQNNAKAFSVKTCDIPVVVGTYSTDEDTAFGDGTSNSNRFGEMTEIIYENTDVPYTWNWAYNEGLDRATVNQDMMQAEADRLELQARAKVEKFNAKHSAFISTVAGKSFELDEDTGITEAVVKKLFNDASAYFVNKKTVGVKKAKVNSDIWNMLIDMGLTVKEKDSSVNIDRNSITAYKGFLVEELPDDAFQTGEVAYFYVENVGAAFTGINTVRSIESENFDGRVLQGHGLAGEYILPDNKVAVAKAVFQ